MEQKATEALELITSEVLERFQRDYIRRYVYESHASNKVYEPTYEFINAWNWSALKREINRISTELWYDPSKLPTFEPENFIHGSYYGSRPLDVRDNLPAILEGMRSSLWISISRPIKFWQQFISFMIEGGGLEKIIEKHFASKGFVKV